ncbi:MAG: GNAT family N-acetyltransferase [Leptospirillia bacterium]
MTGVVEARDDAAIARCFAVMRQLRPHLTEAGCVARIKTQMKTGYRLAFLEQAGEVVAVAGFRILENLAWGRFLYVDDLVTDAARRGHGFGGRLLEWLLQQARESGCDALHLDSGVQRTDAHRFYEGHHLTNTSLHFAKSLSSP